MLSFLKSFGKQSASTRRRVAGCRPKPRLSVEPLEDRCLPTVSGLTGVQVFAQYWDNYQQKTITTPTLSPMIGLGVEQQLDAQYVAGYKQSHGGQSPSQPRDTSQDPFYQDLDLKSLLENMLTETYQANTTGPGLTQIQKNLAGQIQKQVSKFGLNSGGVSLNMTQGGDYTAQLLPGSKLELQYVTHGNTVDFSVDDSPWGSVSLHASFDVVATVDLQLPPNNTYGPLGQPPVGIQVLSAGVKAANSNVQVSGGSGVLGLVGELAQTFTPDLVNQLAKQSFDGFNQNLTGQVGSQLGSINQLWVPFADLHYGGVHFQVDPNDSSQLDMTLIEKPSEEFWVHDLKAQENYPLRPDQVSLVATGAVVQVAPFVDDSNTSPDFNGNTQATFNSGPRYTDIQAEAWRYVKTEVLHQTDANGQTELINITPPLKSGQVYAVDLKVDYAAGTVSGQFSVLTGGGRWQAIQYFTESISAAATQTQELLAPDARQLESAIEQYCALQNFHGVHLDYNSRDILVHIPGMIATDPDIWFTLTLTGPVGGVPPSLNLKAVNNVLGQVSSNGAMALHSATLVQAAAPPASGGLSGHLNLTPPEPIISDLLGPLFQSLANMPHSGGTLLPASLSPAANPGALDAALLSPWETSGALGYVGRHSVNPQPLPPG